MVNETIRTGDIVLVDFGDRVGQEISGPHYAISLEYSSQNKATVVVVPLTSYKARTLYKHDLYLGSVLWWTGKDSVAKFNQTVGIDKQRIIKFCGFVGNKNLSMIRKKIAYLFLGQTA